MIQFSPSDLSLDRLFVHIYSDGEITLVIKFTRSRTIMGLYVYFWTLQGLVYIFSTSRLRTNDHLSLVLHSRKPIILYLLEIGCPFAISIKICPDYFQFSWVRNPLFLQGIRESNLWCNSVQCTLYCYSFLFQSPLFLIAYKYI